MGSLEQKRRNYSDKQRVVNAHIELGSVEHLFVDIDKAVGLLRLIERYSQAVQKNLPHEEVLWLVSDAREIVAGIGCPIQTRIASLCFDSLPFDLSLGFHISDQEDSIVAAPVEPLLVLEPTDDVWWKVGRRTANISTESWITQLQRPYWLDKTIPYAVYDMTSVYDLRDGLSHAMVHRESPYYYTGAGVAYTVSELLANTAILDTYFDQLSEKMRSFSV